MKLAGEILAGTFHVNPERGKKHWTGVCDPGHHRGICPAHISADPQLFITIAGSRSDILGLALQDIFIILTRHLCILTSNDPHGG